MILLHNLQPLCHGNGYIKKQKKSSISSTLLTSNDSKPIPIFLTIMKRPQLSVGRIFVMLQQHHEYPHPTMTNLHFIFLSDYQIENFNLRLYCVARFAIHCDKISFNSIIPYTMWQHLQHATASYTMLLLLSKSHEIL